MKPGRAAFEAFQRVRWPLRRQIPWSHYAVARPAWEAAARAAIDADAAECRETLALVRAVLAGTGTEAAEARAKALNIITSAEHEGELKQ